MKKMQRVRKMVGGNEGNVAKKWGRRWEEMGKIMGGKKKGMRGMRKCCEGEESGEERS